VFVSRDANIQKEPGSGPIDARLDIAYDGVSGTLIMPAGAEWTVNNTDIAKYLNPEAPAAGTVRSSTIKRDVLLKVVGKALGDDPLDITAPPTGTVFVSHTLHEDVYTTRHCTQFTDCVHAVIAGGTGAKLVCRGSSAGDPACAAAPPTTTTTLPPCLVPPEAGWTCCQGTSYASCPVEVRTTGDAAGYCAFGGGVAVPGRCGTPGCAAQGCCLNALNVYLATCADHGIDGTPSEVATSAGLCGMLGGTWIAGPCP